MTEIVITKERWNALIKKTLHYHEYMQALGSDVQDNEIELIISVLKNNTPFEVIESMRKQIKDRKNGN